MKTTRIRSLSFLVVLVTLGAGFADQALAAPILSWTVTPLGADKHRIEIFADTGEATPQAAGYTVMFTGINGAMIQQSLINGAVAVETLSEGSTFDGVLGYSLANDSWFDDVSRGGQGISNNFGPTTEGVNTMQGTFLTNSGSGQTFKSGRIAHLIVMSSTQARLRGLGNFAVAGLDFPFEILIVPEPATLSFCGVGLLCLSSAVRRRMVRRRQKNIS